jgi:cephalosporin hydroxylase
MGYNGQQMGSPMGYNGQQMRQMPSPMMMNQMMMQQQQPMMVQQQQPNFGGYPVMQQQGKRLQLLCKCNTPDHHK